jgi:DDE superfamily endonuclease
MIINLWSIGVAGFGQMSAQLSVEKEANGTLYTESGVSGGGLPYYLIYLRIFLGEGLLPWAVQGEGTKGQTVMFWAGFGYGKRSRLVAMRGDPDSARGGVTARRYIEVLEAHLSTILENDSLFMQDNSRVHTAIIVQDWFADRDIDVLDWPAYSPDMNPIENLWKLLKAKIIELYPELITMNDNNATKAHLIQAAEEAWELLEEELLNTLALGMQKRIDALKAAGGWYTKY